MWGDAYAENGHLALCDIEGVAVLHLPMEDVDRLMGIISRAKEATRKDNGNARE